MTQKADEAINNTATVENKENNIGTTKEKVSRRNFVKGAATMAATAGLVSSGIEVLSNKAEAQATGTVAGGGCTTTTTTTSGIDSSNPVTGNNLDPKKRADAALQIRETAARNERNVPIPSHPNNNDETDFPDLIGNYTKCLPHDSFGEVTVSAYNTLINALNTGNPTDFENITLGLGRKLIDPQSGLAFDLEGTDSHQLSNGSTANPPVAFPPSPKVNSAERAAEMVEDYWMALSRDVPFSQYGNEPITSAAIAELNTLTNFTGPKDPTTGKVTAQTLFRGLTPEDLQGPYVSQFFLQPATFGALAVLDANGNPAQQYIAAQTGVDFMTDPTSWLNIQNGGSASTGLTFIGPRFLSSARNINNFVHVDELFQAYFEATLNILGQMGCPFNVGNPYKNSKTQIGFGTFGNPASVTLVAEVATRALKGVWYQKWFVHRALRPEAFSGLVHFTLKGSKNYPLNSQVLNSKAAQMVGSKFNGNFFLPMAFPEGSPAHPSYGSGHATVAGACATFIKAFFDETFVIPNPVVASDDGKSLVPYTGSAKFTVRSEANKIASNVGLARNSAGVHWRSDHQQSVLLGEAIAISILQDQKMTYNQSFYGDFPGFTFHKFDGTQVTI
jgi:hypothetical protein